MAALYVHVLLHGIHIPDAHTQAISACESIFSLTIYIQILLFYLVVKKNHMCVSKCFNL